MRFYHPVQFMSFHPFIHPFQQHSCRFIYSFIPTTFLSFHPSFHFNIPVLSSILSFRYSCPFILSFIPIFLSFHPSFHFNIPVLSSIRLFQYSSPFIHPFIYFNILSDCLSNKLINRSNHHYLDQIEI